MRGRLPDWADHGDDELSPWKLFIHLWLEGSQQGHVPREAHAHQLLDLAEKTGLDEGEMGMQSRLRKLGRALSRIESRVIGSTRIRSRVLNGRKLYRIDQSPSPTRNPLA